MPSAKRHTAETGHHFYVIYKVARHQRARLPLLSHCRRHCAGEEHCVPRMAPCDMPACETHVGRTQGMCVSAPDHWERSCRCMREHERYRLVDAFQPQTMREGTRVT